MRTSSGLGRRALISSLSLAVAMMVGLPTAAPAKTLGRPVAYPLRHDFSMAVGLPGHGKHEPTSCYDVHDDGGNYACRIVAGVEETGDKRNFFPSSDAVLEKGDEPTYGMTLVNKDGIQYEGCDSIDEWTWECDCQHRQPLDGDVQGGIPGRAGRLPEWPDGASLNGRAAVDSQDCGHDPAVDSRRRLPRRPGAVHRLADGWRRSNLLRRPALVVPS